MADNQNSLKKQERNAKTCKTSVKLLGFPSKWKKCFFPLRNICLTNIYTAWRSLLSLICAVEVPSCEQNTRRLTTAFGLPTLVLKTLWKRSENARQGRRACLGLEQQCHLKKHNHLGTQHATEIRCSCQHFCVHQSTSNGQLSKEVPVGSRTMVCKNG